MPKSSFWRPRPLGVNHLPNPLRKIPPATTPALASDKILHYYAYDFIANPWLGGGGAYRDLEILSRFRPCFQGIRCYVGYYPGAKRTSVRGIDVIPLGFGSNEILSRITYVLASNWRILFHGNSPLGVALSIYSPLWT